MSYSNGIITAPVSIDDVKQALGTGSNDVAILCTSPLINKWAKFKPTRLSAIFTDNWYKGYNNQCGLTIPAGTASPLNLYNSLWAYERPVGGIDSPYRLGDFRGYCNAATSPVTARKDFTFNPLFAETCNVFMRDGGIEISPDYRIRLEDIDIVSSMYLCVVVVVNSSTYYYKTASSSIVDNKSVMLTDAELSSLLQSGTYQTILCLSSAKKDSLVSAPTSTMFYALPYDSAADATSNLIYQLELKWSWSLIGLSNTSNNVPSLGPRFWITGDWLSNYVRSQELSGGYTDPSYFYTCVSPYLHLKYTITNTADYDYTVYMSNMTVIATNNFQTTQVPLQYITVRDMSLNVINALTLSAHTSTTVIVTLPADVMRMNASGAVVSSQPNEMVRTMFYFRYKARDVGKQSQFIRMKNYIS